MPNRIAYMPLDTYPEPTPDSAVLATVGFAATLGCELHVSTFAVDIPATPSAIGGFLIDVQGMARTAEQRSKVECARLAALVTGAATVSQRATVATHTAMMGSALDAAASEARRFDLVLLPWSADTRSSQDMAQALVFEAGVPVILVPPSVSESGVNHIAVAWDGSRVAARAMCDALPLLAKDGRVTVITIQGEKALRAPGIAESLVASLQRRGYSASALNIQLEGRPIGSALQEAALSQGAQLLAMGGFGHSRMRDFILGGATKGVFADLKLAVLLSH